MSEAFTFIQEAEPLKKVESHRKVIALITQQTIECAYFIQAYAASRSFWIRTLKYMVSDIDSKIQQYEDKFVELRANFQSKAIVQSEISILRVLDKVEHLATETDLNDMPYAEGARFDPEKGCLPGTREHIIEEISDWVNGSGDDPPRMFFLSGVAGSGKSAIAHAIAQRFEHLGRLGSSYCFDRSQQATRRPNNLFSTIARDLADLDPQRKQSLWSVIQEKRAVRTASSPREQFALFIVKPAASLVNIGPVLIVIDALDESGDASSRRSIVSILAEQLPQLPPNFRILVTSRPERDIHAAFAAKPGILYRQMDSIDTESTSRDLSLYVAHQLADVPDLEYRWPNAEWCRLLVEKSEGLFQWASTACRFIKGDDRGGLDPCEQLDVLLCQSLPPRKLDALDQLYLNILTQVFGDPAPATVAHRFRTVMETLLGVREPLPISALRRMLSQAGSMDIVGLIVRPLGSLLTGVAQDSVPVRPLHTSFHDFLTDPERSGPFHVDTSCSARMLALGSLAVMKADLCFNICGLDTSYMRNSEILDAARVRACIQPHLSYSCRFWMHHVRAATPDDELLEEVESFLCTRFLYWLEVLSAIKAIRAASQTLSMLLDWTPHPDTKLFVEDALKFVRMFGGPISQSYPHIYLSALSFAPASSKVVQTYSPQFPRTIGLRRGGARTWPAILDVLQHPAHVGAVAFSPDGSRIASGGTDALIRLWNVETGEGIPTFFEGHTGGVIAITFTPDGRRLISGSYDTTIRLWDVETGEMAQTVLLGHTDYVWSLAVSPDGRYLASGSRDRTIRVWDMERGALFLEPLEESSGVVRTVAFSADGEYVLSGLADFTIWVWSIRTGLLVAGPFGRDSDDAINFRSRCIGLMPDAKHVVRVTQDDHIRVEAMDMPEGVSLGQMGGQVGSHANCAFSRDGRTFVSCSSDYTVQVWDVVSGELLLPPLAGHSRPVVAIDISPDGQRVASGSADGTVRIWEMGAQDEVPEPTHHTRVINAIATSPDGLSIVSCSQALGGLIQVWDRCTGEVVSWELEVQPSVGCLALSPDGSRVAIYPSGGPRIYVYDIEAGCTVSSSVEAYEGTIRDMTFSSDGGRLVSMTWNRTIEMWDLEKEAAALPWDGPLADCVAFSPNGKHIACGIDDNLRILDPVSGEVQSAPFQKHTGRILSIAFSPDGRLIASGSADHTARVWDIETAASWPSNFGGHSAAIQNIAFSPNGKLIVSSSADRTICVWDVGTGIPMAGPFAGHTASITSVIFSPDGRSIISGSLDHTIRVWTLDNQLHTSPVRPVSRQGGIEMPSSLSLEASPARNQLIPLLDADTHSLRDHSQLENGWCLGPNSELLFWAPAWARTGLWRPSNTLILGTKPVELDFTRFVHGTSWTLCMEATDGNREESRGIDA
ncbi:WD40 repeat-like protein [Leucogyrophana mollusca]|uniref:WD40 repeat-like protein n=1 Tax=Leucogyrophana mollusca TaxID=85980 RepID=A0ACB8BU17_9AGAM|nr:WD40 repeat-like protein [Leucogyrophana mollusca]